MNEFTPFPIQSWLEHLDKQGKSAHTIAAYRRALQHFVAWNEAQYGVAFDPMQVIPRDVEDWKAHQQTVENARPATINQRLVALSRFFAWAITEGNARSDPTADVSGIRPETRKPKAMTETELRRLLRAVHAGGNPRDIAIVEMLAGTGLRVGELLALRIGDLTIRDRSGVVVVRRGKHGGYRTVPLTAPVRRALREYLDAHPHADDPDAALWLGERGPFRDRSAINRVLAKYAAAAKLEPVGPHV
jgi:integrase/recombinase XerC